MAQFDVIRLLAPYADYAVLAEETEPGSGWAYDLSFPPLVENPSIGPADLGQPDCRRLLLLVSRRHVCRDRGPL